jgi:Putative transposase, YhgA-like
MKNYTDDDSHHIHDKTAKMVLQYKDAFVELLTVFLPHLARKVNMDNLALDTTNYVGGNYGEQFSDIAYRTHYNTDAEKNIAFMLLVEHKRQISKETFIQILGYKYHVWQQDIAAKTPLTTIVAIILDQGNVKKRKKRVLSDYFKDLPPELKKYVPDFEVEFITIQGIPDDIIFGLDPSNILRGMMLMYKHLGDDDFLRKNFPEYFTFVKNNPHLERFLRAYYEYLSRHTDLETEEFQELAENMIESHSKSLSMSTYNKIILKGKQEGKQEGRQEGKQEERLRLVYRARAKGKNIVEIADFFDFSIEEVKEIFEQFEEAEALNLDLASMSENFFELVIRMANEKTIKNGFRRGLSVAEIAEITELPIDYVQVVIDKLT